MPKWASRLLNARFPSQVQARNKSQTTQRLSSLRQMICFRSYSCLDLAPANAVTELAKADTALTLSARVPDWTAQPLVLLEVIFLCIALVQTLVC